MCRMKSGPHAILNPDNNPGTPMTRLLLLLSLLTQTQTTHAFSRPIHELICDAAYQTLAPDAKHFVDQTMSRSDIAKDYDTFAKSCSWADEVRRTTHRETYQYHFTNTPKELPLDPARDCARFDCISQAITRYAMDLNDPHTRPEDRKEALMFLGHFVADIHQPLHVANAEDLGGNRIDVFLSESPSAERRNLHAVWDFEMARRAGLLSRDSRRELIRRLDNADNPAWESTRISQWPGRPTNWRGRWPTGCPAGGKSAMGTG